MDYSRLANSWGIRGDMLTKEEIDHICENHKVYDEYAICLTSWDWDAFEENHGVVRENLYRVSPDVLDWKLNAYKRYSYLNSQMVFKMEDGKVFLDDDDRWVDSRKNIDAFCIGIATGELIEAHEELSRDRQEQLENSKQPESLDSDEESSCTGKLELSTRTEKLLTPDDYPWENAPDWAVCAIIQPFDRACWLEKDSLRLSEDGFISIGKFRFKNMRGKWDASNWKESKRFRPEEKPSARPHEIGEPEKFPLLPENAEDVPNLNYNRMIDKQSTAINIIGRNLGLIKE